MGWPWHFVDLTEAQKQQRRDLLDTYAGVAQISALLPLLALQWIFLLSWLSRKTHDGIAPSSPRRKGNARFGVASGVGKVEVVWRRMGWWFGERAEIGGMDLGRRGEVLGAGAWLAWLLVLCVLQTGEDYLHLTKRFGIVAASQLPLHYLLAMKSPYSPLQFLTRRSHETLNTVHQFLGRVILILLYLHATFYLNFYIRSNLLSAKLKEFYVLCGIAGIVSLTVLGATASPPLRHWSYRVFYTAHVTIAAALLPILFFHVSHIRPYLYESAAIYAVNVALRTFQSRQLPATLKLVPQTDLVEIDIPTSAASGKNTHRTWQPGQHAYISLPGKSFAQTVRKNPFSLASIPSIDGKIQFVARILHGNTALLAQEADPTKSTPYITLEGPYGLHNHSEHLLNYDRVLFVAGGIGGTFIFPLYRQLLADLSPSKASLRRQKVSCVWVARGMADVAWALPKDGDDREGVFERLKVYLTRASSSSSLAPNDRRPANQAYVESAEEGIELEERKNLLSEESIGEAESRGISLHAGRPDLAKLVDETFLHSPSERVAVFVCGPRGLSRSLRKEVRRWGAKGRDIWFWEEEFGL